MNFLPSSPSLYLHHSPQAPTSITYPQAPTPNLHLQHSLTIPTSNTPQTYTSITHP